MALVSSNDSKKLVAKGGFALVDNFPADFPDDLPRGEQMCCTSVFTPVAILPGRGLYQGLSTMDGRPTRMKYLAND